MKIINSSILNIVEYVFDPKSASSSPRYGDYNDKRIVRIRPVYHRCQKYFDIWTDKQVEPVEEYAVWPVQVGTCLKYPDGKILLVTRTIVKQMVAIEEITSEQYNPKTMTTINVINNRKKT